MSTNPFIHLPTAHRWSDRLSFFMLSSYDFGFFRTASGPFTNLLVLCPENKTCQEAAAQAATAADQADQAAAAAAADQEAESCRKLQTIRKSFQNGWVLTGCI